MEMIRLAMWGLLAIVVHFLIRMWKFDKRTPKTIPLKQTVMTALREDLFLLVISVLMIPVLIVFRSWYLTLEVGGVVQEWFLSGKPLLKGDVRVTMFLTSFFIDYLIMLLSTTEDKLLASLNKPDGQAQ